MSWGRGEICADTKCLQFKRGCVYCLSVVVRFSPTQGKVMEYSRIDALSKSYNLT